MGFSDVRASFLQGIFMCMGERFAPRRITASWEALFRWLG